MTRLRWTWLAGLGALLLALPAAEAGAAEPSASSAPAVSPKEAGSGAESAAASATPAAAGTEQSVSMFPIKGDKPLSIRSDELEAIETGGRRRMLFTSKVQVEQGELLVNADRLEAFYPPGGSQPDTLVASGHVRVSQTQRRMLCDKATFFQTEDRLLCVGNAELQQGDDRVRGREIEIFIKQNRVKVRGGATVNVTPSQREAKPAASAKAAPAGKPAKAKP
ncbi:MAG: Lipopolysaccharide transport periplasmic protein LptA [Deltaproteobacteria bacterium]|nr:Lipopolysaccharide transport periplasmic protein LptA [Deltaproteobacteria bacterium]